jgi:hypothetical protein
MELETKLNLWLHIDDIKALNDWENQVDPNQTSGTPLDVRQKIIDAVLEKINNQWDVEYCHNEYHYREAQIKEIGVSDK